LHVQAAAQSHPLPTCSVRAGSSLADVWIKTHIRVLANEQGGFYALDDFRSSLDFMASGFQSAYRWRPDPLASGCRAGSSGH